MLQGVRWQAVQRANDCRCLGVSQKSRDAAWGQSPRAAGRAIMMDAVDELAAAVGVAQACRVLGLPRASW